MSMPKVSVLVTFYNQEKYVDKALESIISQKTDFGIKILVGDDGSSDKTCEEVEKWINRYPEMIELYIMERNEEKVVPGFRASRNRINLLSHVNTELFILMEMITLIMTLSFKSRSIFLIIKRIMIVLLVVITYICSLVMEAASRHLKFL